MDEKDFLKAIAGYTELHPTVLSRLQKDATVLSPSDRTEIVAALREGRQKELEILNTGVGTIGQLVHDLGRDARQNQETEDRGRETGNMPNFDVLPNAA